ncbi:hypothetical protein MesoLjLb_29090 [Mesorhizobium sp. L-8-3]|nr:hypothetical protein MesoLjLb_29090 [Mesorhizobium sp. L-8-3]
MLAAMAPTCLLMGSSLANRLGYGLVFLPATALDGMLGAAGPAGLDFSAKAATK